MNPPTRICQSLAALATGFGLTLTSHAATTLIGETTGNGNFQHNFANNLITDPVAWGIGSRNSTDTGDVALTSNTSGRAFQGNSTIGNTFSPQDWVATRTAYPGGNNAWGFDAGISALETPNVSTP